MPFERLFWIIFPYVLTFDPLLLYRLPGILWNDHEIIMRSIIRFSNSSLFESTAGIFPLELTYSGISCGIKKQRKDKERKGFVCAVVKLKQTFWRMIINFSSLVCAIWNLFLHQLGADRDVYTRKTVYRLNVESLHGFHGHFFNHRKTLWKSKSVWM